MRPSIWSRGRKQKQKKSEWKFLQYEEKFIHEILEIFTFALRILNFSLFFILRCALASSLMHMEKLCRLSCLMYPLWDLLWIFNEWITDHQLWTRGKEMKNLWERKEVKISLKNFPLVKLNFPLVKSLLVASFSRWTVNPHPFALSQSDKS